MPRALDITMMPADAEHPDKVEKEICRQLNTASIDGYQILRRSVDARKKPPRIFMRVEVYLNEPVPDFSLPRKTLSNVGADSSEIIIIGMGPAGMFAAIKALELGFKAIILERGKPVRDRRRDLARLTRDHIVNPDSNYCFGEGGAGTYSDGKLYTRSKKRGDVMEVLQTLVQYGADGDILVNTHPHIGTNKLPAIIENMRESILEHGGEIHFNAKVTDLLISEGRVQGVVVNDDQEYVADNVILATGHSARDIFELLHRKGVKLEAKPFALGVRVEHPQEIIDKIQYSCDHRGAHLPPAPYTLTTQANGRGVYSFCMCPGGIIAPCATSPGEVVTNGWSPSKRDNPYANSGIVTEIRLTDLDNPNDPLAGMKFQKSIEQKAWDLAGQTQQVPAQRLVDYVQGRVSPTLGTSSYIPGIVSTDLREVLPIAVSKALVAGFKTFGKKMKGYYTNEAILHAPESRTSSPVRIPRDKETLEHVEIKGLYPCGEGAGYAGGIVSAAVDGMRCTVAIKKKLA